MVNLFLLSSGSGQVLNIVLRGKICHWSRMPDAFVSRWHLHWLQSRCSSFVLVKHLREGQGGWADHAPCKVCIRTIKSCTVKTNHYHSTLHVMSLLPHFATPNTYKQLLDLSHVVNTGGFILAWDLMSFLISPRDRGTYQMYLMRSLIEEYLYHSLIGHGQQCLCSTVIWYKDRWEESKQAAMRHESSRNKLCSLCPWTAATCKA